MGNYNPPAVPKKFPKKYRQPIQKLEKLYTPEDLDNMTQNYIKQNPHLFKLKRGGDVYKNRIEELKMYIYYYFGGYTTEYIARIHKKSAKICYNRIENFCYRLRTLPPIL